MTTKSKTTKARVVRTEAERARAAEQRYANEHAPRCLDCGGIADPNAEAEGSRIPRCAACWAS